MDHCIVISIVLVLMMAVVGSVGAAAGASTCYQLGDVVGGVLGTFFATAILCVVLYFVYVKVVKKRTETTRRSGGANGGRSVSEGDETDHPSSKYAYDNPFFDDDQETGRHLSLDAAEKGEIGTAESLKRNTNSDGKNPGNAPKTKKGKSAKANLLSVLTNSKVHRHRAQDDSCLNLEPEVISVPLRGIDFTGLGFNVCGNMRDGIFIKDVLHRGPAMESGKIKAGDRILSVTVSFTNMVYEDALTILSYASPYDVTMEVQKTAEMVGHVVGHQKKGSNGSNMSGIGSVSGIGLGGVGGMAASGKERLYHPLYRSHSIADLSKIGRDDQRCSSSASTVKAATAVQSSNGGGAKKEVFVRTSHSLREEASVDLDTTGSAASSVVSEPGGKSPRNHVDGTHRPAVQSRFKVQKVAEVDENKLVKGGVAERKISKSSLRDNQIVATAVAAANENGEPISFSPNEIMLPPTATNDLLRTNSSSDEDQQHFQHEEQEHELSNLDHEKFELILLDSADSQSLQNSGAMAAAKRSGAAGKRKAPPPPATTVTTADHVTTLKVSPDIHEVPSWVKENDSGGGNVGNVAIQTYFSSESDSASSSSDDEIAKKKRKMKMSPGGDSDVAKKSAAVKLKKKDRNRRATSLGDLTSVDHDQCGIGHPPKNYPLERSVSMDLNHADQTPLPLGAQHDQIKSEMEVDAAETIMNELPAASSSLKKQFTVFENLHLNNIYKKSWESLDVGQDQSEIDVTAVGERGRREDDFQDIVLLAAKNNDDNSDNNGRDHQNNKIVEDNMSDVSLSDKMSDVSSSLSDADSLDGGGRKQQQQQQQHVKKMMLISASDIRHREIDDSSSSEDDGDVKGMTADDVGGEATFLSVVNVVEVGGNVTTKGQDDPGTYIHHDLETGSSLVTIGNTTGPPPLPSVPVPHPRAKHSGADQSNGSPNIDPEMAKIFNNITVSNTSKDITVDLENWTVVEDDHTVGSNGSDHHSHNCDDDDRDFVGVITANHKYGNGKMSPADPESDRHYETTLQLDIVESAPRKDHSKVELISFEAKSMDHQVDSPSQQLQQINGNSDGFSSKSKAAVIITNPRLKEVVAAASATTGSRPTVESAPPKLQPAAVTE